MSGNNDNSGKVSRVSKGRLKLRESGRTQKEKQAKKKPIKTAIIVLVAVFALYIAAACFVGMRSNLSTTIALKGSLQEETRTNGYIFREQDVIEAPWDGHFECLVSEGERVNDGEIIGYIYRTAPDPVVVDEIKKVHKAIRLSGTEYEVEYIAGGSGVAEKKLSELARELSDKRQECDLSAVREDKEDIDTLVKRKHITDDGTEEATEETTEEKKVGDVSELEEKLASLERQAGESVKITAEIGGVFSSRIDGLEDELALENANAVVPATLNELDKVKLESHQTVVAGQPLCKVINNYTWKYATTLTEKEAEQLSQGQVVQMRFYDLASGSVKGTVSRISELEGGKRAVVISTNRYVDGIYSSSRISADIVTVDSSGIKLPAGCLRVKDGITGVYVIRLDTARFVPVNLIYKNDEWAIISAAEPELGGYKLQIYDEVIVECKNLEDGKVVR